MLWHRVLVDKTGRELLFVRISKITTLTVKSLESSVINVIKKVPTKLQKSKFFLIQIITDPDLGGPKPYGSHGSGSGTLVYRYQETRYSTATHGTRTNLN